VQYFLASRVYPSRDRNWFGRIGGGIADHNGDGSGGSGWGFTGGIGYEWFVFQTLALTVSGDYAHGDAGDFTYHTGALFLGFTYH
jgi:hypothetical protein